LIRERLQGNTYATSVPYRFPFVTCQTVCLSALGNAASSSSFDFGILKAVGGVPILAPIQLKYLLEMLGVYKELFGVDEHEMRLERFTPLP
jgi:hypothetical protein